MATNPARTGANRPPARKRASAQQRRKLILDAAQDAFAKHGFAGTSMDVVALNAGVTKPVLYDHFESKSALYVATAERVRDELLKRIRAAAQVPGDLSTSFRSCIEAFFAFVEECPAAVQVLIVVPRSDPTAAEAAAAIQAQAREGLVEMLRPLVSGSPPWERQAMTLFLQRGLHAMAEWWAAHREIQRAQLVETVIKTVWFGMGQLPRQGYKHSSAGAAETRAALGSRRRVE